MPATPRSERRTQNRVVEATLLRENLAARGYADAHIASVLSDMDADLSALEPSRDKTRALKQAMMQLDLLLTKYMKAAVTYEDIVRVERFPVPRAALREAVLNAVVHRDYMVPAPIQIRIYDGRLVVVVARSACRAERTAACRRSLGRLIWGSASRSAGSASRFPWASFDYRTE